MTTREEVDAAYWPTHHELMADAKRVNEYNEAWKAKWPNHCTACGGWGGSSYYESHGLPGPGEQMMEPCEKLPETQCHRCGHHGLFIDNSGPCKHCGWNFDDGLRSL